MGNRPRMTRPGFAIPSRWWRRGFVLVVAGTALLLSWSSERGSVERANRVHRQGQIDRAADLYRERTSEPRAPAGTDRPSG